MAANTDPHAAGIVYVANGRVLLLRRSADAGDYPDTWAFPAGHIEEGESPRAAALRELAEETGCDPEDGAKARKLGVANGCVLFALSGDGFAPTLNDESQGYLWAQPGELPDPLISGMKKAVEMAFKSPAMDEARIDIADRWAADKRESARLLDTNGWYEVKGNPLSKAGIFEYAGRQLPDAPDPDKLYRVYRPAEELSSKETLDSFKLIPWIDDHVMLGSEDDGLMPAERKGIQGVVGEDVTFDGQYLRGNIKVFSSAMADLIEAGKRELSAGYRCTYDWTPGEHEGQPYDLVQRDIRGNHLALVKEGRMGPDVAVLDHYSFTLDSRGIDMAEETEKETGSSMTLEEAKEVLKQMLPLVQDIQQLLGDDDDGDEDVQIKDEDVEAPGDLHDDTRTEEEDESEEERHADEVEAGEKANEEERKERGMDMADVTQHVMDEFNRKSRLYEKLSPVVGAFDHAAMTEKTMADYGCKKLGLSFPANARVVGLHAFLDGAKSGQRPAAAAADHADSHDGTFVHRYLEGK